MRSSIPLSLLPFTSRVACNRFWSGSCFTCDRFSSGSCFACDRIYVPSMRFDQKLKERKAAAKAGGEGSKRRRGWSGASCGRSSLRRSYDGVASTPPYAKCPQPSQRELERRLTGLCTSSNLTMGGKQLQVSQYGCKCQLPAHAPSESAVGVRCVRTGALAAGININFVHHGPDWFPGHPDYERRAAASKRILGLGFKLGFCAAGPRQQLIALPSLLGRMT